MNGGAILGQGEDTCVIAPPKSCPTMKADPDTQVSRLVGPGTSDEETEKFLLQNFGDLVRARFISSSTAQCFINVNNADLSGNAYNNGCKRAVRRHKDGTGHINLLTDRYEDTGAKLMARGNEQETRQLLSTAAVISNLLVSDKGPWVVQTDLHTNNIGYNRRQLNNGRIGIIACLADWGRCMIISNPNDFESVRRGIQRWTASSSMTQFGRTPEEVLNWYVTKQNGGQHPRALMQIIRDGYIRGSSPQAKRACVNAIRGWMMHSTISGDRLDMTLLTNNSQAEQARAGEARYPGLIIAAQVLKALLKGNAPPEGTPQLGMEDPRPKPEGVFQNPKAVKVRGADIAMARPPTNEDHRSLVRPAVPAAGPPPAAAPPQPNFVDAWARPAPAAGPPPAAAPPQPNFVAGWPPPPAPVAGLPRVPHHRGAPIQGNIFGLQGRGFGGSTRHRTSLPTRRGQRSSSSSKRRYTHRRRASRTGKGGYRPTKSGRKA